MQMLNLLKEASDILTHNLLIYIKCKQKNNLCKDEQKKLGEYSLEKSSLYNIRVVKDLPIVIFDEHNMALPVWGTYSSRMGRSLNLVTFDTHTDTHPPFNAYLCEKNITRELGASVLLMPTVKQLLQDCRISLEDFSFEDIYKLSCSYVKNSEQILTAYAMEYLESYTVIHRDSAYGYERDGVYISTEDSAGLFKVCNNATIKNVSIENSLIKGTQSVGSICGYAYNTTFQNCICNAIVVGENEVGGIAGTFDGNLTSCLNKGTVVGKMTVGGIAGIINIILKLQKFYFVFYISVICFLNLTPKTIADDLLTLTTPKESIREKAHALRTGKKKKSLGQRLIYTQDALQAMGKGSQFALVVCTSLILMAAGAVIGVLINNVFLIPALVAFLAIVPFVYVRNSLTRYEKHVKDELETTLSIITTANLTTDRSALSIVGSCDMKYASM